MFSAVLGLFSQDLAVDLGTSTARVFQHHSGQVLRQPSVVAVHTDRQGRRSVLAVGDPAMPMLGRTPMDIDAVQPVRDGQIHDYEVAESLLRHLVRTAHGRSGFVSPEMVVAIPSGTTEVERRAVRDSCEAAGARAVHLVPKPLAAGLGAQLPVRDPAGFLIVDIGGGATEISVLSLGTVVSSHTVRGGGEGMDLALVDWLRAEQQLLVGRLTAEQLKLDLGSLLDTDRVASVRGRCLRRGVPRAVTVTSAQVRRALTPSVQTLINGVKTALERTPPELVADVVDHGLLLTGGGASLEGLDEVLREATGLAVVVPDAPEDTVVRGAGAMLDERAWLREIAC